MAEEIGHLWKTGSKERVGGQRDRYIVFKGMLPVTGFLQVGTSGRKLMFPEPSQIVPLAGD